MPFWTRNKTQHSKTPASTNIIATIMAPESSQDVASSPSTTRAHFLHLPGEIRNMIYHHAIYPSLTHLNIIQGCGIGCRCEFPHIPALHASVFRITRQTRAEAISFLCANKELRVLSLEDACVLFKYVGAAMKDIKRFVLLQSIHNDWPLGAAHIESFFDFLAKATSLRYFKLEIGTAVMPFRWGQVNGQDWVFLERVSEFVESRDGLVFEWSAGAYDPRRLAEGSGSEGSKGVRELLGVEREVRVGG